MSSLGIFLVVALSGFISLSYEIIWLRAFSFASRGAPSLFGQLLFYYLVGLAFGAFASRIFCRNNQGAGDRRQLAVLAGVVYLANLVGFLVLPGLARLATAVHWTVALPLVIFAAGLWGAVLPLVSHFGITPDRAAGSRLSHLYVANIAGSVVGTLFTGFILLDVWSLRWIALFLVLLGLALSAGLLGAGRVGVRRLTAGLVLIGATAAVYVAGTPALFDRFYERLLFAGEFGGTTTRFADLIESRSGVIAVTSTHEVFGSGAYDGAITTSLVDDRNMIIRAYGVAALHPMPRHVLMIGLSTGAWAQVIANMPGVETLTVIEINPGYLELIPKYPAVASLLRNPKVEIVIDDGRRWLVRNPDRRFDVIVSNTTFHWRAHTSNLLSAEFLALVRAHLARGGIFHFNTTNSADAFRTAFTVFPNGLRFINFATVSDSPIVVDVDRWQRVLDAYAVDGIPVLDPTRDLDRRRRTEVISFMRTLDGPPVPFGLERRESVLARIPDARVITDDNMLPEWHSNILPRYQGH